LGISLNRDMKNNFKEALRTLDQELDLVMIMENFDESLMLLKRLLCWNFEDVTFRVINKSVKVKKMISERGRDVLKSLLRYEYDLYNYFYQVFEKKIRETKRSKIKDHLKEFEKVQKDLKSKCRQCPREPLCKMENAKRTLSNCPCENLDFCGHCKVMKLKDDVVLNAWAQCIQNKRMREQKFDFYNK